jgi:hypothetical protein
MAIIGRWEEFTWAEGTWSVTALVEQCPQIVLGKRLVVTALDSGPLLLSEEEKALGWISRAGCAISPVIADPLGLFCGEYDEWWVFSSEPVILPDAEDPFVNHEPRIALQPVEDRARSARSPDDALGSEEGREYYRQFQDRFRAALRRVHPETFLCDWLIVSRNPVVATWLRGLG